MRSQWRRPHYSCGGIKTDEWVGLRSITCMPAGMCQHRSARCQPTGQQLLLEAMVFAHRCYVDVINRTTRTETRTDIPDWNARGTSEPKEMILITQSLKELQQVMSDYVGIVRNDVRLQRAMRRLDLCGRKRNSCMKIRRCHPSCWNCVTRSPLVISS